MRRYLVAAAGGTLILAAAVWVAVRSLPSGGGAESFRHAEQGEKYLRQHFYKAAIAEFEIASRQSPGALNPWAGLAAVHIRLGDGPKAIEGASKAVRVAADSSDAWLMFGRAHWLARNLGEAEKAALRARELDGGNLQAAVLLLNIYFDQRDDTKFRDLFGRTADPEGRMQDLAVRFAVRAEEFRRAHDLQVRQSRRELESEILRIDLALKREPGRSDLYPRLIRALVTLGRSAEAIAARRNYAGTVPLDLEMGKAYWLESNRTEAIRAFERASLGITHKLSAEAALAAITGERRHWLEAFRAERLERDYFVLAQLEDVLKQGRPLERAFVYRYAGLFDESFFNQSAEQARMAIETEADPFDALMTLGTAYLRLGRLDEAVRYVEQGRQRYPNRAEVWSRLGQLALAGDGKQAADHMKRAVDLEPGNASYLYNYGWLLDQMERDAEAAPYYERAIAASSLSFEAMNNLALIEAAAGHRDRAVSLLDRAVASNPENEAAYVNRGNFHASTRSWRQALADYQRAGELNPGDSFAVVESARTYIELGDVDRAIEALDTAVDADPHAYDAYTLLASAYRKKGREREAEAALAEARRIRPDGKDPSP